MHMSLCDGGRLLHGPGAGDGLVSVGGAAPVERDTLSESRVYAFAI